MKMKIQGLLMATNQGMPLTIENEWNGFFLISLITKIFIFYFALLNFTSVSFSFFTSFNLLYFTPILLHFVRLNFISQNFV